MTATYNRPAFLPDFGIEVKADDYSSLLTGTVTPDICSFAATNGRDGANGWIVTSLLSAHYQDSGFGAALGQWPNRLFQGAVHNNCIRPLPSSQLSTYT